MDEFKFSSSQFKVEEHPLEEVVPDIVLIPAAGWKLGEIEVKLPPGSVPARCPDCLMPLTKRHTVLSRLIKQLKGMGIRQIYVGVGNPDCYHTKAYEALAVRTRKHTISNYGTPPWTWERVEQVQRYGAKVIVMNNPLLAGSYMSTVSTMLDSVNHGKEDFSWKRLMLIDGDYIFRTEFLKEICRRTHYSSIFWLMPRHPLFFMTPKGAHGPVKLLFDMTLKTGKLVDGANSFWNYKKYFINYDIMQWQLDNFKECASWLSRSHFVDEVPESQFSELGTKLAEYQSACEIAESDPV